MGQHVNAALKYARDVVSGEIPACKWVKLACKRQLDDLKRWPGKDGPYRFDESKAEHFCTFVELHPHVKGREWVGQTIKQEPWQDFIDSTVFGWYTADGTRRFRHVYIEVPRKNAKSTKSAIVGNYMFAADGEPGAEVYSAATTRDQAKIVFGISQQMARKMPAYRKRYGVEVQAHNLNILNSASKFEPLSAEGNSLDGLNIHCAIIDELHAHKTRQVYDVLDTATGSRTQPLLWCITTAGFDRSGVCYDRRIYVTKLLEGTHTDESYFGIIYTLDEDDDWTEEASWFKANPNLGVSVYLKDIALQCRRAMASAQLQNTFLTKRLNVWVNADVAWMNMQAWAACGDTSLKLEQFEGKPCVIALDLATKIDVAAKIRVFKAEGEYYVFGEFYLPEDAIESGVNTNAAHYAGWVREGLMTVTPGNVIDFDQIYEGVIDDTRRFQVNGVAYDPWQAQQLANQLVAQGAPAVEYRATVNNFSEPMKQLEALVLSGKLHHDGSPVLTWMISNVVGHLDAKDNIYPRKERPENKIDGPVALIMALGWQMRSEGENMPMVYDREQRGLLTV